MARPAKIDDQTALPFATYSSFVNFLDDLNEMGVLPNKINNGVFKPSYSGSGMNLIQRAFRQFGLTNDEGVPDEARLKPLVDPATRPAAMQTLLQQKYAGLIALPLATATPPEVNEWFAKAGMDATATRKAKAFFFAAARENGIGVHSTVAGKAVRRGAPRGKRKSGGKRNNGEDEQEKLRTQPPTGGSFRTVKLASGGGEVTLAVTIDPMELSDADQAWVFGLIGQLRRYEENGGPPRKGRAAAAGAAES